MIVSDTRLVVSATLLGALLSFAPASAGEYGGDWPNWRGPLHTGESPGGDPPVEWGETGRSRGYGFASGEAVSGADLFVRTRTHLYRLTRDGGD